MADFEPNHDTLRTYVRIVRRRFYWLLALTILAVAAATAISSVQPKEYSATTQLLVQPESGTVPISGTQQTVSPTDVLTELQLITSGPVQAKALKALGFTPKISAGEVGQTNVIGLTATASTPGKAAQAANEYAKAFVSDQRTEAIDALTSAEQQLQSQINAINSQLQPLEAEKTPSSASTATASALSSQEAVLKEQLAQLQVTGAETPGGVEIVSYAALPKAPSSPKPLRNGLEGLVVGIVLGIAAVFAAEYFDDKVYTKEQAERLTGGVPVLAMIPKVPEAKKSPQAMLISEVDPFSPATEAYRSLRTSMQFAGHNGRLKTILITSASGSEGKTSTVANLAVVLAKAGERVVVVGCDLRRPRIGGFLGRGESPGFTNVLLGRDELKSSLQPVANTPGLALLATGLIPPNPAELLGSEKAASIFRLLAGAFDTVIIDSPPLLPVADAQILARYADAILMVVAAGETTEAELERATELLLQVGAQSTGVVLNKVVRYSGAAGEYGYGYGYGYKYRYTPLHAPEITINGNGNGNGHLRPADPPAPQERRYLT
jgi:succinoglycan biosynthesis transport protein ExoP